MLKIIILCIIILVYISYEYIYNIKSSKPNYPCNEDLTEDEYINHMITHHEVAVYMSEKHLHNTKNPIIFDILRNIIRLQNYEINIMKDTKIVKNTNNEFNDEMSNKNVIMDKSYRYTQGDFIKPNTPYLSDTYCDPSFFDITHNKNLHNMTDEMYIKHMIPHHQVAVDMSKRILNATNDDFIIDLAYKIIHSQQLEISKLYNLSKSKYIFESNIL
jgi:uncharacterized protein (DUF305 family)